MYSAKQDTSLFHLYKIAQFIFKNAMFVLSMRSVKFGKESRDTIVSIGLYMLFLQYALLVNWTI